MKATARARKGSQLLSAADAGDADTIKGALGAGADANDSSENGVTPLMLASRAAAASAVRTLLDAKADANVRSQRGCTALGLAATHGSAEAVKAHRETLRNCCSYSKATA